MKSRKDRQISVRAERFFLYEKSKKGEETVKRIALKNLYVENFKGLKKFSETFSDRTECFGKNASGKTTLLDSFTWCLFGKDSQGRSDFQIRPVDVNGATIDNTEIIVAVTLAVTDDSGESDDITLEKHQVQNWVKKRGSQVATFQGNQNKYSIDGYPSTEKDYSAKVSEIIDESLFKLMTDPTAFANLPWKEQRQILVRFVSEVKDADIIALDEVQFAPIKDEVIKVGGDKVREKYAATLKRLKEEQKGYPIRIDETTRNILEVPDESSLTEQKKEAESELKAIQDERNSASKASKAVTDIQSMAMQKRLRMAEIERSTTYEDAKKNGKAQTDANNAMMECRKVESERDVLANKRSFIEAAIKDNESAMEEIRVKFKAQKESTFPESETICPTCGRPFDADRISEMKSTFDANKRNLVIEMQKKGDALWEKIKSQKAELESINKRIAGLTADAEGLNAKWEELKENAVHPVKTDVMQNAEYAKLHKEANELDRQLASMDNPDSMNDELLKRENAAREKLDAISAQYAQIEANRKLCERIEELKAEQMECSQKVADCERIIYLIEQFTKLKMDTLSDRINSHFKKVRFKLFETQINGAIKECCVMQIATNGSYVDYGSANHAGQLLGGLDVIDALGELNQISVPVWVDNAECFSSDNLPESDSQMILLTVSDDEELVIERG